MSETVTGVGSKTATIRNNHTLQRTLQMSKSADKAQIRQQNSAAKVVLCPIDGKFSMFFKGESPPIISLSSVVISVWTDINLHASVCLCPVPQKKSVLRRFCSLFHKVLLSISDMKNIDLHSPPLPRTRWFSNETYILCPRHVAQVAQVAQVAPVASHH